MLSNSHTPPEETKKFMWVELLNDHIYCMLPSVQPNSGRIRYYTSEPEFLTDLSYTLYIGEVRFVTTLFIKSV